MVLLVLAAALPVLLIAWFAYGALAAGYPWRDCDWNQDGHTTLAEYLHAADVGRRPMGRNGESCWEYFEYKDGAIIRLSCSSQSARP
jgi:hypothetical protein